MRKMLPLVLFSLLLCAMTVSAMADTLSEDVQALQAARTLQEQLDIINRIANEHADELEKGGFNFSFSVEDSALLASMIPADWEEHGYIKADALPEVIREHKCIALFQDNTGSNMYGSIMVRLPEKMRATSIEEAEYALVFKVDMTESGYHYVPTTYSYHRDYKAYALNLKTGEAIRFWFHRNSAKSSGRLGELNGDTMSFQEIWTEVRDKFWGQVRYELGDDAALIIGFRGKNAFVKGYQGKPVHVDIPAEVEGHPVVEIASGCFLKCKTLSSISLPISLERINEKAFSGCSSLQGVLLPEGLKKIETEAFYNTISLTEIIIPGTVSFIGEKTFGGCTMLSKVIIQQGVATLGSQMFYDSRNLALIYLPGDIQGMASASIDRHAVIYVPVNTSLQKEAQSLGYTVMACDGDPLELPDVRFITEGSFEFRIIGQEAALIKYLGDQDNIVVPDTINSFPVTRILFNALVGKKGLVSVTLPQSVISVHSHSIRSYSFQRTFDVFIPNSNCLIEENGIQPYSLYGDDTITIHALAGSLAQRYVADMNKPKVILFEPWGEGVNPDTMAIKNVLPLAEQVIAAAKAFWKDNDQKEYSWFSRIPNYDATSPDATAVLRFSKEQFDDLALLMGGEDNIAQMFATIVNTQWNLPYAKAAAQTTRVAQLDPVPDGSCAVVALCYRTDIVLTILREDGFAQAALVCSSPEVIKAMTPEYINSIASSYGVVGECSVYGCEETMTLIAQ